MFSRKAIAQPFNLRRSPKHPKKKFDCIPLFHYGQCPMNLSPVTTSSIVATILYSTLILWGVWVGVRQVYQGFFRPQELLNPLFGNRQAITIFTFHLAVVSLDLFV